MTSPPRHGAGFRTQDEETAADSLPVTGTLPPWLTGTLVRNGPARFEVGPDRYRHWFDGLAMLHRFTVRDGTVSYANRFLRSRDHRRSAERGRISMSGFATDPCRSIFGRICALFAPEVTDNANVNVARIADRYVAMTETPIPVEFDPWTLETLGVFDHGDDVGGLLTTAHPHFDHVRGVALGYTTRLSRRSTYVVFRIPDGGTQREPIAEIPVRYPAYMHSFGMTERYLVLAEFPLVVDPLRLFLSGRPFIENFRWEPERGTRFRVIDRETGEVRTHHGEAFFAFHHVNAFERDGEVCVDVAAYPDPGIIDALYLHRLRAGDAVPRAELRRCRLPSGSGEVRHERLGSESIELPRMDYNRRGGREYRFAYGVSTRADRPDGFQDQLVKCDVLERSARTWREDDCYPGEPVFVAAPGGGAEDEGVVLSVVLDAARETSYLLLLDAASFEELARVEAPHRIPFGFHGQFFADGE
jgi:beta,beta-carotene 9',10'-dioxygenase